MKMRQFENEIKILFRLVMQTRFQTALESFLDSNYREVLVKKVAKERIFSMPQ
jgi:hypothetical protein